MNNYLTAMFFFRFYTIYIIYVSTDSLKNIIDIYFNSSSFLSFFFLIKTFFFARFSGLKFF